MSGNGMHGKQSADEYIRELERELYDGKYVPMLDGTADTEYCDCDKIEKDCWWYLPVSLGSVVLAYALGWISAVLSFNQGKEMTTLTHKGYGRIYCENADEIKKVSDVIKELDEFEHGYLPSDMIATYDKYPQVVYTGKFSDMDMSKLTAECWRRGIKIWVHDAGHNSGM